MSQSKTGSAFEAVTTTVAAIVISLLSYQFLGPLIGLEVTWVSNIYLTGYFTIMSFIRTYIVRRLFNRATVRRKMRELQPHVGSIQSLPRHGYVPDMRFGVYKDSVDASKNQSGQRPVRSGGQEHESTGIEEDKELRK
jgi:hypothetical protein